jgi:multidrug resistance efflux pump
MTRRFVRSAFGASIVTGMLAAAVWPIYREHAAASPAVLPGMVRQTEIRLGSETTGRLVSLAVVPGQHVRKGELLAILDNPELAASLEEARAAVTGARAERDRIYSGVRAEQVAIAAEAIRTAQANLTLTEQQNDRVTRLFAKGFASREQLDESSGSLTKAQADLALKKAQHDKAVAGPTAEERALADANVALAEATVGDLQSQIDKTKLASPVDGIVGIRVAELGEIIVPGQPVITIEVDSERWFTFTLREDDLRGATIGTSVKLRTAGQKTFEARVTELRPLGEFATWRAARAAGDHDVNSFRVRLDPTSSIELEPGMTVWFAFDQ